MMTSKTTTTITANLRERGQWYYNFKSKAVLFEELTMTGSEPEDYSDNDDDGYNYDDHDGYHHGPQHHHQQQQNDNNNNTNNRRWTAERVDRAGYQDYGSPASVTNEFKDHLMSLPSCRQALHVLLNTEVRTTRDYSLEVDAFDLLAAKPVLGHLLLKYPATFIPILEKAIVDAQKELNRELEQREAGDNSNNKKICQR